MCPLQTLSGDKAVLECSPPRGFPEPVVTWRKDEKDIRVQEDPRLTLHPDGNLIIDPVSLSIRIISLAAELHITREKSVLIKNTHHEDREISNRDQEIATKVFFMRSKQMIFVPIFLYA